MRTITAATIGCILVVGMVSGYLTAAGLDSVTVVEPQTSVHTVSAAFKEIINNTLNTALPSTQYQNVRGAIVNHHLLASQYITDTLTAIQHDDIARVVLLSPNHFNRGDSPILASTAKWKTPFGTVEPDADFIRELARTTPLVVDERPFEEEHGISNIVPFFRTFLPDVNIVPIIIKNNLQRDDEEVFINKLLQMFEPDDLIVVSVDFSHTFPIAVANAHDEQSMAAIRSLNTSEVSDLDVDSRPSLRILLTIMNSVHANQFKLIHRGNSASIIGDPELTNTTSYITGLFKQ